MSKGTTHHAIRIPDDLWAAAKSKATEQGDHLSEVIRDALRKYVADQHPKMGDEVTAAGLQHIDNCPECRARFL